MDEPILHIDALNPKHRKFWNQPRILEKRTLFFGLFSWYKEIGLHELAVKQENKQLKEQEDS